MFTKGKKVELVLLIFVIISAMIAFSAFKLSKPESAIAADENKTEYTLSDFFAVPDDGIDFSSTNHGEGNPLKLITKTVSSLKFSFALQLNENVRTSGKVIYFRINTVSCVKCEFRSSDFTATLVDRDDNVQNKEDKNAKVIIKTTDCFKDCKVNDLIVFRIEVIAKQNIALQVSCGNKDCEGNISYSATKIKLLLWSKGLKSAKLYDADANIKNTSLTVKNESGDIISSVDTKALSGSEIVKAVETEQKKFIGFEYNDKLYKTTDEVESIDKNAVVTARTTTLFMEYGARIRTIEPFGIRFAAVASYSVADYGIMLTTKDIAKNSDSFTLENLENSDANVKIANKNQTKQDFHEIKDDSAGLSKFAISLIKIKKENYNLVFAARAFAKIEYADGSVGTVYSDFSDDNCRSLYDVARKGIENSANKNDELYREYCDGVIDITISDRTPTVGYASRLYSATPQLGNDDTLTITFSDVKDGFVVADNVKCITVNGKRIVGFKYDGGKIQINVSEFLS